MLKEVVLHTVLNYRPALDSLEPWIARLFFTNFGAFAAILSIDINRRKKGLPSISSKMVKMLGAFNLATLILAVSVNGQSSQEVTGSVTTAGAISTGGLEGPRLSATRGSPDAIYTLPPSVEKGAKLLPNILDPKAVDPQDVCPGYKGSNVQETERKITADLTIAGQACNVYGNDIADLTLTVEYQSDSRLHIEITPKYIGADNSSWFILPEALIPKPEAEEATEGSASFATDLEFTWDNEPTFSFTVTRKSTNDTLFSTKGSVIIYEDQFIEFGSSMPENYNLYGMGEAIHAFRMGNNYSRTFFAADVGNPLDYNSYSNHPFYLDTRYFEVDEATGEHTYVANATDATKNYKSYSHGSFLRNAHPMEALFRPEGITWRALGGNIDLYFYAGPTQVEVTKQYQLSTIGLPAMQQYWTFGFHQCRWGYRNWTELQQIVDEMERFEIPMDTIWSDIDYMNQYRDFTNDENTHPIEEGKEFLGQLHAAGKHWMPIIDAAIYIPNPKNGSDAYETYDRGNETDSFLRNPDGSQYIGAVWPGYTVFPDMIGSALTGKGASDWWINEMVTWHEQCPFDGAWIDMNEVSSFCVGSCGSGLLEYNPVHPPWQLPGEPGNVIYGYPEGFELTNATEAAEAKAAESAQASSKSAANPPPTSTASEAYLVTTPTPGARNVNWPPYVINNVQGDLAVHAVSPNATHSDGSLEYDHHNLYGHQMINSTYASLLKIFPGKRPFIIGRSTFAGSGKWTGHWGGDNASKFLYMYFSIPQALSFSLFGIPMFGPDTCGFNGNTDEELCNRWMQLSAFFTFYRNHNVLSALPQEPYRWSSVAEASRKAMKIRYSLLPYIYTIYHEAHTVGSTVMRALAWEFPNEPQLADSDRQFLLGPALMITPVLVQGATNVSGVFPGAEKGEVWYDWYTQRAVEAKAGENKTIDAPLGHIPVFVRGGYVLPQQEPALTTRDARDTPWSLIVARDLNGNSNGTLYVDDGESLDPEESLTVDVSSIVPLPPFLSTLTNITPVLLDWPNPHSHPVRQLQRRAATQQHHHLPSEGPAI